MFGSSSEEDDSDADESLLLIRPAILAEMEKSYKDCFEFLKEYDENIYEKYLLAVKTYVCCDYELLSTISAELIFTYGFLRSGKVGQITV